jgi:glycosyltransferase involved in cell wall biosynthesis
LNTDDFLTLDGWKRQSMIDATHQNAGSEAHGAVLAAHRPVRPLRILHLLGGLSRGGIETWLMHVLRRTDRRLFEMDFIVRGMHKGDYEDEVERLGSKIGRTLNHRHPLKYASELRRFVEEYGPYDIVHSHLSEYDGLMLRAAYNLGARVRISHSHNDLRSMDGSAPPYQRAYLGFARRLIKSYATHCLAASGLAALSQFGPSWRSDPRVQILHYGIDLNHFTSERSANRRELRRALGVPDRAFVIGHVGRLAAQKNHEFLIEVFALLAKQDPTVHLLMVGAGPRLEDINALVARTGLSSRVTLLGSRPDIPQLMLDAMDVFLFPSIYEGLGIVLIEAQAAGLPCVVSDGIPEEARIDASGFEVLSLSRPAADWADRIRRYQASPRPEPRAVQMSGSSFDIAVSAKRLFELYARSAARPAQYFPNESLSTIS